MQTSDLPRFRAALTILGEATDTKLTPEKLEAYAQVLADVPIDVVEAAIRLALDAWEEWYYPRPATLLRFCREISEDRRARAAVEGPLALPADASVSRDQIRAFIQDLAGKKALDSGGSGRVKRSS